MRHRRITLGFATAVAVLALAACVDDGRIVEPDQTGTTAVLTDGIPVADAPVASTVVQGDGFTRANGETAGALWEVTRPDEWNGDLVLLMQGSSPAGQPPSLDNPFGWQVAPAIEGLLARGYGVARSSYRRSAVPEGARDTRIAQAAFTAQFGAPDDTWLWGWSLGGAVGHQLVESGAGRYAGFLSVCSDQVGGTTVFQYRLDTWAIFNQYFPGALPWELGSGDADLLTEVLPAIQNAFVADPLGYIEKVEKMAAIDQLQLPLGDRTPEAYILTILGATLGLAGGGAELIEASNGLPVGNVGRVYTSEVVSTEEMAELNAAVGRYEADRGAQRSTARLNSTGRTHGTPILALHTDGDAVVPVWMPRLYEDVAGAAGEADNYVLRVIPGFGHCELTPDLLPDGFAEVQIQAFDDLVAWVREGVKPSS